MPVIGLLVILGSLASPEVGALVGSVAGGLLGAIGGRHLGQEHVLRYQEVRHSGKLVVPVHRTPHELESARRVLGETTGRAVSISSAA
jgi:hypothetical protein